MIFSVCVKELDDRHKKCINCNEKAKQAEAVNCHHENRKKKLKEQCVGTTRRQTNGFFCSIWDTLHVDVYYDFFRGSEAQLSH